MIWAKSLLEKNFFAVKFTWKTMNPDGKNSKGELKKIK